MTKAPSEMQIEWAVRIMRKSHAGNQVAPDQRRSAIRILEAFEASKRVEA